MRATTVTLVVAAVIVVAACGDDGPDDEGAAPTLDDLEAHEWVLDAEASTPALDAANGSLTLAFSAETLAGTAPCNGFHAEFSVDAGDVRIGPIAQTLMSCGDELDAAEAEYLAALEAADSASIDDEGRLVLSGDDVNLVYDPYDAADVIVGEWHIVNVATEQAIEGVPEGVDPVLVVEESGDLSVTGLCNTLATTWELDGDQLSITPPISTLMACEPPELMQTESAIGAALARADTVSVTPDMLTIFDESGAIVIVATANPA